MTLYYLPLLFVWPNTDTSEIVLCDMGTYSCPNMIALVCSVTVDTRLRQV